MGKYHPHPERCPKGGTHVYTRGGHRANKVCLKCGEPVQAGGLTKAAPQNYNPVPRGLEVRASHFQLWRLNQMDGALDEALTKTFGETRTYVTHDAAAAVLSRRADDGEW